MSQGQKKRKGLRQKSPPVLKYLQGILRKYPDGGQILKELIQNADDAGAEEVILFYDERSFETGRLFSEGLESAQGPALLAYNNSLFSEADWEGIQSPGISHKEDDPSAVGRFGLGFNSVYHITDFPSILSDTCLGVLDTQQTALDEGGQLWDVSDWEEAPDQFQPFWAALKSLGQPCPTAEGHFPGTLFRFPLRQSPSKISENLYSPERVRQLLLTFLNDAPISLLFLRNIKRLTLGLVGFDGAINELLKAEVTTHPYNGLGTSQGSPEVAECHLAGSGNGNLLLCGSDFLDDVTSTKLDMAAVIKTLALGGTGIGHANSCDWLVLSAEAKKDAFPELWDLAVKVSSKPALSLAYCLQDKCTGRLSCVLPLPATEENTTGLPLHISAPFQLTDDRRHVQWSEEGSQARGADGCWNHLLMEEMLPVAYCQMILLASACPGDPYGAWPDPDQSQQLRYKPLVAQICQRLIDMKLLVWIRDGKPRMLHPHEAVILPEKVIDKPVGLALQKALTLAGSLLADAPLHVRRALVLGAKDKAAVQEATTKFVRETLRQAANVWHGISLLEKQLLLEYLVGDGCYQELKDLSLLPTANGYFTCFGGSGETVFVENHNFPRILLTGLAHQFLPKDLKPELLKHLQTIAEKRLFRNLVSLDRNVIEQNLSGSLPKDWISSNTALISWCPKNYPKQPPLEWLSAFWSFLSHHAPSLAPFKGCPLIPLTPLHNSHNSIQLARLLPQSALLFQSWDGHCLPGEVAGILERLGCTVIRNWEPDWCHRQLREYILEPTPQSVLQAFAHLGVASVAGHIASLSTSQVESLSAFLSAVASLSPKEAKVLTELPLFFKLPSLLPPFMSGLVPAQRHLALDKNLVPPVPSDLLTPEPVVLCLNEAERRLLLQIRERLLGTPDLCLLCVRAIKKGAYANRAEEAKRFMLWVLHNGDSLFSQSRELQTLCCDLPFLDCGSGKLSRPCDLYDPENDTLRDLLRPCHFPTGPFREPAALRTLRALGLKSDLSAVCPTDALMAATEVSQLQEAAVANAKSQALIQVCNKTPLLSRFSSQDLKQLRSLPWVPATNTSTLVAAEHFLAPESLCSEKYAALVGLVMGLTNAFCPEAAEKLGLQRLPPPEKVMENLARMARGYCPEKTPVLIAKLHSIYQHMQQYLSSFRKPPAGPVVWNGTGFLLPADVVLAYPDGLDLTALIPRVPLDFQHYSQLFAAWGVRKLPKEEELCQALHKLADEINARPQGGTHAELFLVIAALDWLHARGHHGEREMSVPVQIQGLAGFALRPTSSVLYCDMDRACLAKLDGDPPKLVHESVSSATAAFLGVEMLSTRLSGLEQFEAQAWGPSEPITLRIRNNLREYSQDADVFLELLQNAEDAGAQSCRFLVDLREHNAAVEGLLDPGMAVCQGPALWAQNDALFSETDFSNIIRLGAATKEHQEGKIGRFGLGFCTVYHMTDVPSLLSGHTLLIFDPNITHLQKHIRDPARPGIRLNLTRTVTTSFPEQFRLFKGIFGYQAGENYQGTLLRLPFRTKQEAKDSQICCDSFGPSRIKALQTGFQEMYQYLLIFLCSVQEVSLTHLPVGSSSPEATQPLATVSRQALVGMGASSIVQLTATWNSRVVTSHYLLHSCSAQGEALKLFKWGKEKGVHFSSPVASVALPLHPATTAGRWVPDLDGFKGRIFCFLPLPIESGLPLHLTAAFAVESNRKGLWDATEKGEWNKALLRDSVLGAWLGALFHLQDMYRKGLLEDYEYHAFWPDVHSAKYPFSETVKAFYQALVNGIDGEQPVLFSDGQRWCPAQHACILNSDIISEEQLRPIASRVFSLLLPEPKIAVSVPSWVKMNFKACLQGDVLLPNTYNWARFLRELVLPNLAQLAVPDRDVLILHALDMNDAGVNRILTSLPCIPTTPNKLLKNIKELVHPRGCVAPLYTPEDGRFPMGADFLQPERLLCLERLGMTKDWVEMEELIARARTVAALWHHDPLEASQRARCVLNLLNVSFQEHPSNTTQVIFRDVPFLPAVLPANQRKLCCPREIYFYKLHLLVGLSEPVLDKAALGKGVKLSKELKEFLGLNRQPPFSTVLRQLEEASRSSNALSRTELANMAQSCYDFLDKMVQKNPPCMNEVSQKARTFPFVFVGTGFVSACRVAHHLAFNAAPYLFQLPEEYQQQKKLWECIGLPETFKVQDYATVLQTLAKNAAGQSLSKKHLDLVLRLITVGLTEALPDDQQLGSYEAQSIFFPDKDNVLRPLPKLLFDDTPWLPHENGMLLCHDRIPREIAIRCGIPTTKNRVLSRQRIQGLSFWATDFGPKEELCTRLANILRDYSSSQDVLKELLQNADDAGANVVHFVWDQRQHPTDRTFSKEWNELQGPALCIYNDQTFQMCDIKGIQTLGSGGKGGRRDAIGKYGLGFSTVYHLTDCPAFVTGDSALCIFDPMLCYLPDSDEISPGGMYSLAKDVKDTIRDVYNAFLPDVFNLETGTLFRLPLRTPAGAASSRICQRSVSEEDMEKIVLALKEEADCLVMFLNHVRCLVFSIISEKGGAPREVLRIVTEGGERERLEYQKSLQQAATACGIEVGRPVRIFYRMKVNSSTSKAPSNWLVGRQIGVESTDTMQSMQLPYGGVAACLDGRPCGRGFCTLPLPEETGLPIHINGNFAVDSARHGLRKDGGKGSASMSWNSLLLRFVVAPLYCHLLDELRRALGDAPLQFCTLRTCQTQLDSNYLQYFPLVTEDVPQLWQWLVTCVYELAYTKQLPLVPVYRKQINYLHTHRMETVSVCWSAPKLGHTTSDPYFLQSEITGVLELTLQNLGMNLVPAFQHLQELHNHFVKAGVDVLILDSPSLCCFLGDLPDFCLPYPLHQTPVKDRCSCSALLNFCLGGLLSEDPSCLEGLPLLVTRDDMLRCFTRQQPAYHSDAHHLFPYHQDCFSACLIYAEVRQLLVKMGFLKDFTLYDSVAYIQEMLSLDDWVSSDERKKWLSEVWVFFENQICKTKDKDTMDKMFAELVSLFKDSAILPVCGCPNSLAPLQSLNTIMPGSSGPVTEILCKLGFAKLDSSLLPPRLATYCIQPRLLQVEKPAVVLEQLAAHRSLCWDKLNKWQIITLFRFLTSHVEELKRDSGLLRKLKALPVFETHQGKHVALTSYKNVYLLKCKFPKESENFKELYETDERTVLLRDRHLNQNLSKSLNIGVMNDLQQFIQHLLPLLPCLPEARVLEALKLLLTIKAHYLTEYEAVKEMVVSTFQSFAFIRDKQGVLRRVSYFYDEHRPFFQELRLDSQFVPGKFYDSVWSENKGEVKSFLCDVGLQQEISDEDFLVYAAEIAKETSRDGASKDDASDLCKRRRALLGYLLSKSSETLSNAFLEKVSKIHFLLPQKIPKDLCCLQLPYVPCNVPVALQGSLLTRKVELSWTSAVILPYITHVGEQEKAILTQLGVLCALPAHLVLKNLSNVCQAPCKTHEARKTRGRVLKSIYDYLSKQEKLETGCLKGLPVVLVDDDEIAEAQNVVVSLKCPNDFRPYLYKLLPKLAVYMDVLEKLGVEDEPSIHHYASVLARIHGDTTGRVKLHPNLTRAVFKATQFLFQLLDKAQEPVDFSELKELYLPGIDGKLYPSNTLVFSMYTSGQEPQALQSKFRFLIDLSLCSLPPNETLRLLCLLPEALRPKNFSDITAEHLEKSSLKFCAYGEHCESQNRVKELLVSSEFQYALVALLKQQGRTKAEEMERLFEGLFSPERLEVVCCEKVCTVRMHNSESLEGTQHVKIVYVATTPDGKWQIYLEHQDSMDLQQAVQFSGILATEVNKLSEEKLNQPAMMVFMQILVCQGPQKIAEVLKKNDVPLHQPTNLNAYALPPPGEEVPEEWYDSLDMSILHTFRPGDYVGYLDSSQPGERYLYAIVLEALRPQQSGAGQVQAYLVNLGGGRHAEVSAHDLYHFRRNNLLSDLSKAVVLAESSPGASNTARTDWYHKPLSEAKKEVDACLPEIWTLSGEERRKALRRLYLCYHPDKNLGQEDSANEIFKYLKEKIKEMENNGKLSDYRGRPKSRSSYHRNFSPFWDEWDQQARQHQQRRKEFSSRGGGGGGGHCNYNFWSFHKSGSNYSRYQSNRHFLEEASRWLRQAKCDLKAAASNAGTGSTEWLLYKTYRAVEKALIAAEYYQGGRFDKNLTVAMLAAKVAAYGQELEKLPDQIDELRQHGMDDKTTQYPCYHNLPTIPNEAFLACKEQDVLLLAGDILNTVKRWIGLE
ncbi:sacsin-like [Rhineura floridana]|uniref:sacsin-like n=1 Tax=Rhineura floridana TaxID=261503 RepID=UPI002AC8345E|nr:sacsin-like [Rhineura floridana]